MIDIRLSKIKTNEKKKEELQDLGIILLIYCGIKENRF